MTMKTVFIISLLFGFASCSSSVEHTTQLLNRDTIAAPALIGQKCDSAAAGYYEKYGYVISRFYEEVDQSAMDVNEDGREDSLAIFSPLNRIPANDVCDSVEQTDRLLFIVVDGETFVYPNVIRNELGIAALGTEQIISNNGAGFALTYHMGQACFFEYDIHVGYDDEAFYVRQISLRSACPGDETKEKHYNFTDKKFLLTQYTRSMIDSLRTLNKM
jgi:hypothetical protein